MSHDVTYGYESKGVALGEETIQGTAVAATNLFEPASETFSEDIEVVEVDGLSGARSAAKTNETLGKKDPRGGFTLPGVRYSELLYLLQYVLGGYATGSAWLTSDLPSLTIYVDKVVKTLRYAGCLVNEFTLESSAANQALTATLDAVAMSMVDTQSFPTGLSYAAGIPLVHRRLTLTAASEATYVDMLRLRVANQLDADTHRNSQDRVALYPGDTRMVDGALSLDWNSAYSTRVWDVWRAGGEVTLQADYTDGTNTASFRSNFLKIRGSYPQMDSRLAKVHEIPFVCKASAPGAQDELQIVF